MSEPEETTEAEEQTVEEAAEEVAVQANELADLAAAATGDALGMGVLRDVPVQVTIEVGRARLSFSELVALERGSVLQLDREAHEPADILVNGKVVARGEIVTLDNNYGVRVTHVQS